MIYIYGASDDLVEIEGDIREEFYFYNEEQPMYLATSNGFVFRIEYGGDGVWEIRMKVVPLGLTYTVLLAGSEKAQKLSENDYSDVLVIDHDVEWVVGGTEFVKK